MLLKSEALKGHLQQKIGSIYLLFGDSPYLFNEASDAIKKAWKTQYPDSETSIIDINNASDWQLLNEISQSYSLFSHYRLFDIRYDKKTLDAAGKNFLTTYLNNIDESTLFLLSMANLPKKQVDWLINQKEVIGIQVKDFPEMQMLQWINQKLLANNLNFERELPRLIHQYSEGNMLAAAQTIEKLALSTEKDVALTIAEVKTQLTNQCNFELYELSDACLSGNTTKVMQLLEYANNSKIEANLVLWILTQEIRLLLQLSQLIKTIPLNSALAQLKIWPQKANLYQNAFKKIGEKNLIILLQTCKKIDERIKSGQNFQIWQSLEQIALSLSLAQLVGPLCIT